MHKHLVSLSEPYDIKSSKIFGQVININTQGKKRSSFIVLTTILHEGKKKIYMFHSFG